MLKNGALGQGIQNRDKWPQRLCCKCKKAGHWAALCPWDNMALGPEVTTASKMLTLEWSCLLQSAPTQEVTITELELRTHMDIQGRTVTFLLGTGATYSVFAFFSGTLSSQSCTILEVAGRPTTKNFILYLGYLWNRSYFIQSFLAVPECPTLILRKDFLQLLGTTVVVGENFILRPPLQMLVKLKAIRTPLFLYERPN